MSLPDPPHDWRWRYSCGGSVRHLVRRGDLKAACGHDVWWAIDWLGSGDQDEIDKLAALPPCRRCVRTRPDLVEEK